jgi:hypothetical protein
MQPKKTERKVEVEVNGKRFRVPEHMVRDMSRFGGSLTKKIIKSPPTELLSMMPKKIILPVTKTDEVVAEKILEPVPDNLKLPSEPAKVLPVAEIKKERKKPVRSKKSGRT